MSVPEDLGFALKGVVGDLESHGSRVLDEEHGRRLGVALAEGIYLSDDGDSYSSASLASRSAASSFCVAVVCRKIPLSTACPPKVQSKVQFLHFGTGKIALWNSAASECSA